MTRAASSVFMRSHAGIGSFACGVQSAAVVDAPDVRVDESRRDQRAAHARRTQIAMQRFGERAHRELAHGVRRTARRRQVSRHAAHDHEAARVCAQASRVSCSVRSTPKTLVSNWRR